MTKSKDIEDTVVLKYKIFNGFWTSVYCFFFQTCQCTESIVQVIEGRVI